MADHKPNDILHHVRKLAAGQLTRHLPDGELLDRFVRHRDEAAFAALVERHGAMVRSVCRRLLRHDHDADDACQAAFLVLARKAASVRKRESLASWLHGVALHVATNLKRDLARRNARATQAPGAPPPDVPAEAGWREVQRILDEELARLPDHLRAPVVLCCLEGRTRDEAARQLGWSPGTLRGRLERGRALLRSRLTRRGLAPSVALLAGCLGQGEASAGLPPTLTVSTVRAALHGAAGGAIGSAQVVALAQGVLRGMTMTRLKFVLTVSLTVGLLSAGSAGVAYRALAGQPGEVPAARPAAPAPTRRAPDRKQPADADRDRRAAAALEAIRKALDDLPPGADVEQIRAATERIGKRLGVARTPIEAAREEVRMWEERAAWSERMSRQGRRYVTAARAEADHARLLSARLKLDSLTEELKARIAVARSDVEMWTERSAWSERMSAKGYITAAQVRADKARLEVARATLGRLEKELGGSTPDKTPPTKKAPGSKH